MNRYIEFSQAQMDASSYVICVLNAWYQQINIHSIHTDYTQATHSLSMVNARPRASSASYLESIGTQLAPIFDQVQHTTANHRKNLVSLRKIQEQCSSITEPTPKGLKLIGEKAFNTELIGMVNRILSIKKGEAVADRVVKFVAGYVAYTTEQGECF
ncbi:MAG: hypothetical protein EOP04_10940 [Proteobacteria bacterium]|nr:MAG: hypothetical protein EOP04_10940 [Pseudomonadota bacterium]